MLLKNSGNALPLSPNANVYVAGRNADNIGNQAGGWTIQWQGASGDIIPGTTILEGIKEVAPQATVTYSIDASAPMTGADVGVVVVGETPYAEGFGDVGGPECGFCTPAQLERSHSPCSLVTRQLSTTCAMRSRPAWCWWYPAARRCSPTSSARWTHWLPPGCRAAKVPGSRMCSSADARSLGALDDLAAHGGTGADQHR